MNLAEYRQSPGWPQCYDGAASSYRCHGGGCHRRSTVFGVHYPTCPERYRQSGHWQVVVTTYNASKISPLAGWPDLYLAWVTWGITTLESAFAERMTEATKRGTRSDYSG